MNIPKIIFKSMSLEENINVIKWAYFEGNGDLSVSDYTIKYFPMLANLDGLNRDEIYSKIEETVTYYYNKSIEAINNEICKYNKWWEEFNDEFFIKVIDYLNVDPIDVEVIEAEVGLIPVFPRYLDTCSFAIGVGVNKEKLIETCAHESLHFFWFKKWQELYPEIKKEEYESPHLVWKYSEMVVDPILNSVIFNGLFSFGIKAYDSFYDITYDGNKIMEVLINVYNKDISIEEKIKEGYEYLKIVFENKNVKR